MAFIDSILKFGKRYPGSAGAATGASLGFWGGGISGAVQSGDTFWGGATRGALIGGTLGAGAGMLIGKFPGTSKFMGGLTRDVAKAGLNIGKAIPGGLTTAVGIPGVVGGAGLLYTGGSLLGAFGVNWRNTAANQIGAVGGLPQNTFTMGGIYDRANALSDPTAGMQLQVSYNRQARSRQLGGGISPMGQTGTFPQMAGPMHRAFMTSTYGLTQGLHQGRHNG